MADNTPKLPVVVEEPLIVPVNLKPSSKAPLISDANCSDPDNELSGVTFVNLLPSPTNTPADKIPNDPVDVDEPDIVPVYSNPSSKLPLMSTAITPELETNLGAVLLVS